MNVINSLLLMMIIINSRQNVIKNMTECIQTINNSTASNGTQTGCPSFSQFICPTKCDPSCKRPLIKRSMCRQPITCHNKACVCGPDYVKDNERKCIPRERCSESCPPNEIFKLCPLSCEIHCGNINDAPKKCPEDEREDHECIASCVCPTGLIRDYTTGLCVKKENCSAGSAISCPPNEEYKNCSSVCDRVCNRNNTLCNTTDICKKGCFCQKGFIRQNLNAKCIPEDHCLADSDIVEKPKKSKIDHFAMTTCRPSTATTTPTAPTTNSTSMTTSATNNTRTTTTSAITKITTTSTTPTTSSTTPTTTSTNPTTTSTIPTTSNTKTTSKTRSTTDSTNATISTTMAISATNSPTTTPTSTTFTTNMSKMTITTTPVPKMTVPTTTVPKTISTNRSN